MKTNQYKFTASIDPDQPAYPLGLIRSWVDPAKNNQKTFTDSIYPDMTVLQSVKANQSAFTDNIDSDQLANPLSLICPFCALRKQANRYALPVYTQISQQICSIWSDRAALCEKPDILLLTVLNQISRHMCSVWYDRAALFEENQPIDIYWLYRPRSDNTSVHPGRTVQCSLKTNQKVFTACIDPDMAVHLFSLNWPCGALWKPTNIYWQYNSRSITDITVSTLRSCRCYILTI